MSLLLPSHGPGSTPDGEYAYLRKLKDRNGGGPRPPIPWPSNRSPNLRRSKLLHGPRKSRSLLVLAHRRPALPAMVDPLSRTDPIQHKNPGAELASGLTKKGAPMTPRMTRAAPLAVP